MTPFSVRKKAGKPPPAPLQAATAESDEDIPVPDTLPRDASYDHMTRFRKVFRDDTDEAAEVDSDDSDFVSNKRKRRSQGGKRSKARKADDGARRKQGRVIVPEDELSDCEYAADEFDPKSKSIHDELQGNTQYTIRPRDAVTSAKHSSSAKKVNILVKAKSGEEITINFNLADLLKSNLPQLLTSVPIHTNCLTLRAESIALKGATSPRRPRMPANLTARILTAIPMKPFQRCFLDLPYELRVQVYRLVLRPEQAPVDFQKSTGFKSGAALLRACKQVADEAATILYGETCFHFARNHQSKTRFWKTPVEVGYRDCRRFLEMIGPANISRLKYVEFTLSESAVNTWRTLEDRDVARFTNDGTLHLVFRLLGSHAVLNVLYFNFESHLEICSEDWHFLAVMTQMRTHHLVLDARTTHAADKIENKLKVRLEKLMCIPKDENIDEKRVKTKVVGRYNVYTRAAVA